MAITIVVGTVGNPRDDERYAPVALDSIEKLNGDGVFIRKSHLEGREDTYVEVSYSGKVVDRREMNGARDSDFLAMVETDPGVFMEVEYASTSHYTYGNGCKIDATEDVQHRYAQYRETLKAQEQVRSEIRSCQYSIDKAKEIQKGDSVVVVKGRKVPKGTSGVVFYIGPDQYKQSGNRIGFRDADGTVYWTSDANLENPDWMQRLDPILVTRARKHNLI